MRKIIIGLILIILIGFIFSFSYYFFKQKIPSIPPKVEVPKAQEVPKVTLPKVIYNLAGSIQKLEKSSFTLEANIPKLDEAGQPIVKTEIRRVLITLNTKFSRLTFVEIEPGRKTPQETSIAFQDLKIGDYIEVISNRDISQASEFEVTQVRVLPKSF